MAAALGKGLTATDIKVRDRALDALHKLKEHAIAALPSIKKALDRRETAFILKLIDLIREIGPDASETIPDLLGIFQANEKIELLRIKIIQTIGTMRAKALPYAKTLLAEALKSNRLKEREEIVSTIGEMKLTKAADISAMLPLFTRQFWMRPNDHDKLAKHLARVIGTKIGLPALEVLVERIKVKDDQFQIREGCILAIGEMGPTASVAAEFLKKCQEVFEDAAKKSKTIKQRDGYVRLYRAAVANHPRIQR